MANKIREFWENVLFALNLDGTMPEYIAKEIEEFKHPNVAHEIENLTSIEDFNADVEKKLGVISTNEDAESFFNEIVGYQDIKKLILKCIQSKESIHIILDGAPASAKSMFLLQMQKKLKNSYYVDCTNATGPGMVKYLFEHDVKYLLLDEVEKMDRDDQNVLLNVMETGMLTSTKVRQTASKEVNLSIYATTNDIDAISKPFRSRFMEFSLPEYKFADFQEIAVKLLGSRYGHDRTLALKVADTVWNKINSRDVRDMLSIAKLSNTIDDVDFVATTLQKYRRKKQP